MLEDHGRSGCQRTMFIGVVKGARGIEVFPSFGDVPSHKQRTRQSSDARSRKGKCLVSFMRERKELSCEVERRVAVKCCKFQTQTP